MLIEHRWCSGNIFGFHPKAGGSIPPRCIKNTKCFILIKVNIKLNIKLNNNIFEQFHIFCLK